MAQLKKHGVVVTMAVFLSLLIGCGQKLGLISYDPAKTQDGYTLMIVMMATQFNPDRGAAILIDMEGNEIHRYTTAVGGGVLPGAGLLPGGSILGMDITMVPGEQSWAEVIQEAWNGDVIWSYSNWENMDGIGWVARQHHDLIREGSAVGYYAPNQSVKVTEGNTMILAHADDTLSIPPDCSVDILDDIIYEVDWEGNQTSFPVWRAIDHKDEFGFDEAAFTDLCRAGGDWLHVNTISRLGPNRWYDEDPVTYSHFHPDHIILDSRHAGFIIIIDHLTGAVVWRVGPDYSPGQPWDGLGMLVGIHNAHMIQKGLPGAGNILVYDNGGMSGWGSGSSTYDFNKYTRYYSRVIEFDPVTLELVWEYSKPLGDRMSNSFIISNAQRLPNGNTLITNGVPGQLLEVTPAKEVVWEYRNEHAVENGLSVYRSNRVPPEWIPGNPSGYIFWE